MLDAGGAVSLSAPFVHTLTFCHQEMGEHQRGGSCSATTLLALPSSAAQHLHTLRCC